MSTVACIQYPKGRNDTNVHPLMNGQINVVYPSNVVLVMKRDYVLIHVLTWVNIENILLSKRSQQKTTYHMILFIGNIQLRQIHRQTAD